MIQVSDQYNAIIGTKSLFCEDFMKDNKDCKCHALNENKALEVFM